MKKSLQENVKLVAIVGLVTITPLLSSTCTSKYLIIYFILNILIIAVGADAGLLSFFLDATATANNEKKLIPDHDDSGEDDNGQKSEVAQGSVKGSPSNPPSIFFIEEDEGGEEESSSEGPKEDDQENGEPISGQELYHKAETFIGNFYKQLKMQREESWNNKLHAHGG